MDNNPSTRTTQVLSKRELLEQMHPEGVSHIIELIQAGEEPRRIFNAILDEALISCSSRGAALFLRTQREGQTSELLAKVGLFDEEQFLEIGAQIPQIGTAGLIAFDLICQGAELGSLVLQNDVALNNQMLESAKTLAYHASVCFERQRNNHSIQTLHDRLEVLNELNQLIAGNASLERLIKNLVRECAFRFSSDIALAFILNESKTALELKGCYGCTKSQSPVAVSISQGLLGQVLRMGGHISVRNLANHPNHGLDFLEKLGIQSAEICCLEVRGETLGILINAFRRDSISSSDDLTRFGEFCQAAAVAIANSHNQERIIQYTTKLEELVNIRTSALGIATQKAEEANRAKSQFLANMSHELRTPLTSIVGYSSVLVDGIFGELNDKQRDALQAICKSSDHLKNLIDDVLNLARIESGKEKAEPTQVSVKEVLSQASKLMLQSAITKGIQIQPLRLNETLSNCKMFVDIKHIQQIIINLMSNAVKYTPSGGKVWIEAEIASDKVRININDSGVGIPKHKQDQLFERFERGEDTYSRQQEGTGIGLNLTRHLVELNGGRIGVESEEGKGSCFWIMMPLASEQESNITINQNSAQKEKIRIEGLNILVVDDNVDTCEVLKEILKSAGAVVQTAQSVRQAIASLEEHKADIVLTDLAMPGESGLVLIDHIRKGLYEVADVPIIVLSACAFESDKQSALAAGASVFIPKPFSPNTVISQVRDLTLSYALGHNRNLD